MDRSIFRASLLGSNNGDQEKKRKISLSTSQFTRGENKPENSELEKGNSPKRKLETTDNEENDNRPLKKQKLVPDNNADNLQDQKGLFGEDSLGDDFESFFESTLPDDNVNNNNSNQVPRENTSEENSINNNTNESGDKDVDEEGLESLEEMNLSEALFDSDSDEHNNQSEANKNPDNMAVFDIKDDEVSVTSHKNNTSTIDLKKAHPNDDDDFDIKSERKHKKEDDETDSPVEQSGAEGEKEQIGDLILSPEGEEPVVKVVAAINRKLRPYQREGVKFLYNLYRENKGGILGDDMGLGKTVQTISFISSILAERKKPVFNLKLNEVSEEKEVIKPALIIAPSGVVMNWEREFQNWGKLMGRTFIVHRYMGPQRDLTGVQRGNCDIVLSSYDTFRRDFELINSIDWLCIVFDEVHKVKDRKAKITVVCKQLKTSRRYGLTGTVMQNNFEELWTLLDFVRPNCLKTLEQFRKEFINAIKNGQRRDATPLELGKSKVAVKRLNRILKDVILRRDQSIIKDLLPGKDDNIVFCQLSELQLKIYKKLLQSNELQILIKLKDKCACGSGKKGGECCLEESASGVPWKKLVFPAILTLQKIANHPGLLLPKTAAKAEEVPDFVRTSIAEFIPEIKQLLSDAKHDEMCGKMRTLASLLNIWSTQNKKVLLFSYSTRMLDILEKFIKLNEYTYSRLDGAMGIVDRQKEMDNFNKQNAQDKFIFLISTKAGGLGLNITSASIVVVFDASWNVTNDLQAQDRAYRIGQTKYTHVYRLVSAGTIEEMVYNRQIYKQQMASIGVEGRHERRYFTGVLGVKGSEGEIFGLANLLKLNTDKILTSEIIKGAKAEESQYRIEKRQATKATDGTQDLMKQVLDSTTTDDQPVEILDLDDLEGRIAQNSFDNGLAKLMRENGVVYAHNNKQILGDSQFERKLAEDAARALERSKELERIMNGKPARTSDMNLSHQPYTGISPQMYSQLSPSAQAEMASYLHKTTMAGLSSSSTHPAVSSLYPEKGRPIHIHRYTPSSYLPKDFKKQQQLITISSEESDDDDDVQIDNELSAPRIHRARELEAMLARQRELVSRSSEASRIPLPQQQLHDNLSGARPFQITVPLPSGVHQAVQAVQHRGIPPAVLGPAPNLGLDTSPPSITSNPEAMARLQKYFPLPLVSQQPPGNASGAQPAVPLTLPQQLQGGPIPMAHPLANNTAAANNGSALPALTLNSNTAGMNQFRAMFPQHNFDNLLPKKPPTISNVVSNNQGAGGPPTPQPVSNAEKQNLAAQVIDID